MVEAIEDFEIEIDKDEVYRYLGYRNGQHPNYSISSLIDEEIDEAYKLIQPSCCYHLTDIKQVRQSQITLESGVTITSKVLSEVLGQCHEVAIFLVTIGQNLENRVARLMDGEQMLRATVLDAVGSEATEKTACYLEERVEELATANSAQITPRCSPGYWDWDITQQRVLLQAMDSCPLMLTLTEECFMVPVKSVSGIIGLGQFEKQWGKYSPCSSCPKMDCQSRR